MMWLWIIPLIIQSNLDKPDNMIINLEALNTTFSVPNTIYVGFQMVILKSSIFPMSIAIASFNMVGVDTSNRRLLLINNIGGFTMNINQDSRITSFADIVFQYEDVPQLSEYFTALSASASQSASASAPPAPIIFKFKLNIKIWGWLTIYSSLALKKTIDPVAALSYISNPSEAARKAAGLPIINTPYFPSPNLPNAVNLPKPFPPVVLTNTNSNLQGIQDFTLSTTATFQNPSVLTVSNIGTINSILGLNGSPAIQSTITGLALSPGLNTLNINIKVQLLSTSTAVQGFFGALTGTVSTGSIPASLLGPLDVPPLDILKSITAGLRINFMLDPSVLSLFSSAVVSGGLSSIFKGLTGGSGSSTGGSPTGGGLGITIPGIGSF
jgi:hypothetical protein